jgi:hypothetical protein
MRARLDGVLEDQPVIGTVSIGNTAAVNLTQVLGSAVSTSNPVPVTDKPNTMEASQATLVAGTSTPFTFTAAVEVVRVKNWSTTDRVLVKSSAISSDVDAAASRVGKAPTADVPNSEFYPVSGTIFLRCAAAAEVTVEGFRKT